jgi:hypothetical protein
VYKKKQKELKRQKQEREECFANIKEREDSHWCNLPKLRELHGAREGLVSENSFARGSLQV